MAYIYFKKAQSRRRYKCQELSVKTHVPVPCVNLALTVRSDKQKVEYWDYEFAKQFTSYVNDIIAICVRPRSGTGQTISEDTKNSIFALLMIQSNLFN